MREKNRAVQAVFEILLALIIIAAIYFVIRFLDQRDARTERLAKETETEYTWNDFPDETVKIKLGRKKYVFSHPVKTYLFMGTDKSGNEEGIGEDYQGSMADTLMLVVIDDQEKSYGVLQLNRDTVTEVPMLLHDGTAYASCDEQLCTAHWYGKDKKASCENTVNTVSKMLGGIPIDGYYALQMEAMPVLNHEVGGVTVTLEDDMTNLDPEMKKGATIKLTDKQAEILLHSRYDMKDDRNTERMRRQRLFLSAFLKTMKERNAQDVNNTIELYDRLREYATEGIDINELTSTLQSMNGYTDKGIITIDGESKIGTKLRDGKEHWEFYMDEDSLDSAMHTLYPLVLQKGKK